MLDAASLGLFATSAAYLLVRLGQVPPLEWWPALAAAALLGVCAADLVTGAIHWFFDGFFHEQTPILGRAFVQHFREHHRDPNAVVRHGVLEVSGNNALGLCPLLWLCTASAGDFGRSFPATALLSFAVTAIAAILVTSQLHRWAHAPRAPRGVRWLQRHRWILSPREHARHHRGTHDRAFCVTTGWMNPVFDLLVPGRPRCGGATAPDLGRPTRASAEGARSGPAPQCSSAQASGARRPTRESASAQRAEGERSSSG